VNVRTRFGPPRRELARQLGYLVALNLFAGSVLTAHFLAKHSLYWDNLRLYSYFRDNLNSLNYFGEIAWWNPAVAGGLPFYYPSILGVNGTTPLFAALAFAVWLLGRLRVYVSSYHVLYVLYLGFAIPLLFELGLFAVARQVLRRRLAVYFVVTLAAFSPAVVFSLSDSGLEQSAYSLLFAAALLAFVRRPARTTFAGLACAAAALAVSFNHLFLYWNVVFVPLFVGAVVLIGSRASRARVAGAVRSIPVAAWLIVAAGCVVCALPAVIAFAQGGDLVRSTTGTRIYSFGYLRPGHPLEVLAAGTPGVGFEYSGGGFRLLNDATSPTRHVSYGYLGMLVLPLAFVGLAASGSVWRWRVSVVVALLSSIVILSAWSPLFSLILAWPTPLRAVNHYSDGLFRHGLGFVIILAAGLGLEAIIRERQWLGRWVVGVVLLAVTGSMLLYGAVHAGDVLGSPLFGFALVIAVLYLGTLVALVRAPRRAVPHVVGFLIFLSLVDTSTVAYWHVRRVIWGNATEGLRDPAPGTIGMADDIRNFHARRTVELRHVREFNELGRDIGALSEARLFDAATVATDATTRDLLRGPEPFGVLLLAPRAATVGPAAVRSSPVGVPSSDPGTVSLRLQSYSRLEAHVVAPGERFLFLRIPHSPFWGARVNGEPATIERAFLGFTAVRVPAGSSVVVLHFVPPALRWALAGAYSVCALLGGVWFVSWFVDVRRRRIGGTAHRP
jgi:hypothetical protein